jgi:hypothetical protein
MIRSVVAPKLCASPESDVASSHSCYTNKLKIQSEALKPISLNLEANDSCKVQHTSWNSNA